MSRTSDSSAADSRYQGNGSAGAPSQSAMPTLSKGYIAVPIDGSSDAGLGLVQLRLCVVVRQEADAIAGNLVIVRHTTDVRVLLGCLCDAGGHIWDWVQIWIQTASGLARSMTAADSLSNHILDQRWDSLFDGFCRMGRSGGMLLTGAEKTHPAPLCIDPSKSCGVVLKDSSTGSPWRICTDDALLTAAGLPPYSTSLHRYLSLPSAGATSTFVPVTNGAPVNDRTTALQSLLQANNVNLLPFNIECGRMFVRRHSPIPVTAILDVLNGRCWKGLPHGLDFVPLSGAAAALRECASDGSTAAASEGNLFMGRHGRWGRVIEGYHLKLRLLADMVAGVRQFIETAARPLLSLSEDSFEVRLAEPGRGLPFLWGADVILSDPGDAVALSIPGTDVQFFERRREGLSIYQPESAGRRVVGICTLRIRQVIPETTDGVVVEGTLATNERLSAQPGDVVCITPMLGVGPVPLYASLESNSAKVEGELRFRTLGCALEPAVVEQLQRAAGVTLPQVPLELIPLLSTPCDLYSLAVLAIRTLFVDGDKFPLPVALDEVISLARKVAAEYKTTPGIAQRIRAIFQADSRWFSVLGPQRLAGETISIEQAFDLIPGELWWDTLAMIVQMFPGIGPDSICKNFGDAPTLSLHQVFIQTEAEIESLIHRSRSLIVIDWQLNREIRSTIRTMLGEMSPASPPVGDRTVNRPRAVSGAPR